MIRLAFLLLCLIPLPLFAVTLDLGTAKLDLKPDGSAVGFTYAGGEPSTLQLPFALDTESGPIFARSVRLDGEQMRVEFENGAVADFTEVRDVIAVAVSEQRKLGVNLLFDPERNLEERLINEQFNY